ncbi:hypothetical protein RBB82_22600 [Tunturiibacter lichenicola]
MDRASHRYQRISSLETLPSVCDYHLACWSNSNTIPTSIEDRELDVIFKIPNLFAEGRLSEEQTFRCPSEIRCLCYGDDVFEESKLQGI